MKNILRLPFLLLILTPTLFLFGCGEEILCYKVIRNQEIRHTQRNATYSIEEKTPISYEKENTWKPDDFEKYMASFKCIIKNTDNYKASYKVIFEYQVAGKETNFKSETIFKEIKSGESETFIKSVSGLSEGSVQDFRPLVESTEIRVPVTTVGLARLYYKKCSKCNCNPDKDEITGLTEDIEFVNRNQLDSIINQRKKNE
jgi:hypothetical protein